MQLGGILQKLGVSAAGRIDPGAVVAGVTQDSRRVGPGWIFVARPGLKADGRRFIPQALSGGAVAIVTDLAPDGLDPAAPLILTPDPGLLGAAMSEMVAGSPSLALRVVGVTGTNGKTTVATLVSQWSRLAGMPCGLIGTVEIDDGSGPRPSEFTTPPAERISELLARMRGNGCLAAAMEVSSHSLDQRRPAGLHFRAAVFTNLTGDHLDYHGDMDRYAGAKARLFEQLGPDAVAVVNADDSWSPRMVRACRAPVLWCSSGSPRSGAPGASVAMHSVTPSGMGLEFTGPWGVVRTRAPLFGAHNAMNLLQAFAVCTGALGIAPETLATLAPSLRAPNGRLEPVQSEIDDITVLVDFAHTDDALANALRAARLATPAAAELWAVFGCGGDKDRTKRPRMGAAASALADRIVITSDNPRTEDPEAIIDQICAGVPGDRRAELVRLADRREAIRRAVLHADAGDVIVLAGKGHEVEQILPDGRGGTHRVPFDDHVVAREALAERRRARAPAFAERSKS